MGMQGISWEEQIDGEMCLSQELTGKLEFLGKGSSPALVGMCFITGKDCLVAGQQVHLSLGQCSLGWHKLLCRRDYRPAMVSPL